MDKNAEKYIAKALEGYEANEKAITEAIDGMELQLAGYKDQREEMREGISEMRELMGLEDETEETRNATLELVNDGTAIE